jgi:hypothetical protein
MTELIAAYAYQGRHQRPGPTLGQEVATELRRALRALWALVLRFWWVGVGTTVAGLAVMALHAHEPPTFTPGVAPVIHESKAITWTLPTPLSVLTQKGNS